VVKVGDIIPVVVIEVDDSGRINLSHKAALPGGNASSNGGSGNGSRGGHSGGGNGSPRGGGKPGPFNGPRPPR